MKLLVNFKVRCKPCKSTVRNAKSTFEIWLADKIKENNVDVYRHSRSKTENKGNCSDRG